MGWMGDLGAKLNRLDAQIAETQNRGKPPRDMLDEEYANFYEAASQQRPPKNRDEIRAAVISRNPVRYHRLMREYRWMQKQMKKMGLSPEDARWLL